MRPMNSRRLVKIELLTLFILGPLTRCYQALFSSAPQLAPVWKFGVNVFSLASLILLVALTLVFRGFWKHPDNTQTT